MRISERFGGAYLKAADLQGRTVKARIRDCREEHLDDETKPLLLFEGKEKGLILNKTNAGVLAAALGDETDVWRGREVELFTASVPFQGKIVDAIRVRVPTPPPTSGEPNDEIPW